MFGLTVVGVTGAGGDTGTAVLRSLKLGGLPVEVVGFDQDPFAVGLHAADRGFLVPPADDDRFGAAILKHCIREKVEALIVGSDAELKPLSRVAQELVSRGCTPILSAPEVVALCFDRGGLAEFLAGAGFPFVFPEEEGPAGKEELAVQVLVAPDGEVVGTFTSRNVLKRGVPVLIQPVARDTSGAAELAVEIARLLVPLGLRGPCGFRITEPGPRFNKISPRFNAITAARAAMGFNEVEAALRSFVFGELAEQIRNRLAASQDLVCARYVTEYLIPLTDVEELQGAGHCRSRGWSVHL